MRRTFSVFLNSSVFRYIVTGGVGFIAEVATIWIATRCFEASSVLAVGISFWVGILVSFLLQKLYTFRNIQRLPSALTKQSVYFAILVGINYAFTLIFVSFLDPVWHSPELARAVALIITTAWNYLVYRFIIFK